MGGSGIGLLRKGAEGKRRAEIIEPDREAAVPVQGRRQRRRQVTVDRQAREAAWSARGGGVVESVRGGSVVGSGCIVS
jgi:hypothetical protein